MPSFFQFTQGSESRTRPVDASPLLGRFRAVPPSQSGRNSVRRRSSQLGLLSDRLVAAAGRGSVHVGYGAIIAAQLDDEDDYADGSAGGYSGYGWVGNEIDAHDGRLREAENVSPWQRLWLKYVTHLWVNPKQGAVKRVVDKWWSRYGLLVFLPALLVRFEGIRADLVWAVEGHVLT
jgi:hypothetical protein